ncbi:hypothetical protein TNIN_316741, partial [Trichonephila inaurata madagascariensis]
MSRSLSREIEDPMPFYTLIYITLDYPVVECGHKRFQMASPNKKKLERVHLNRARLIPNLRHSCSNKMEVYSADNQAYGNEIR